MSSFPSLKLEVRPPRSLFQFFSMTSETQDASRTRHSAFSLDEFEELVSAALDINSDRFPDGTLALSFNPECPFLSTNKNDNKVLSSHIYSPLTQGASRQQHNFMHPPLDSIDFGRASCVPGLGCASSGSSSNPVPTITFTAPPSPSKSRLVLNKIKRGASAFVARTRTLSTPAKRVTSVIPGRNPPPPPLPTQIVLNPRNINHRPIPTVSISAAFKNNLQLRSAVSLVDLECFNNSSAYSLATNTADFYDDESDFVPYLPLACQYERAGLKSPSLPTLLPGSRSGHTGRAVTIAAPVRVPAARTGVGTREVASTSSSGNQRNRCTSSGNLQNLHSAHVENRRRTLSAATTSSATSTSDSASPVTPRSVAFLATGRAISSDQNGDTEHDGASFLSLDSGDSGDERVDNGQGDGIFDEDVDPFAKGSVQIVRTKSRAKPSFQLYNPDLIIGPGSAGEPVVVSNARSHRATNTSHDRHHHQQGAMSDSTSTSLAVPKSRPTRYREQGKRGSSSTSPTPISRMKKTPVVFPLMPGETQEDRKREEESMAKYEDVEEWTLCLGKRDVPGSAQSESDAEKDAEENNEDRSEEAEESEPKDEEKNAEGVRIGEKASVVDGERGRRFSARRSIPQLRVSHYMESGAETSGEEGYFTDDWTLQLPLYNVPQDPLLAQNERRIRKSTSHSPAGTSFPDEERRRATSFTSAAAAPKMVATRFSVQSLPRSSVIARPSIDELTLRDPGPEPLAPLPPVPSEVVAFPSPKQDKLTPPSSSSARSSYCSNGPADARASMISVASMASRTTSSTTTVVPGPWQREQMQQKGESSRSFSSQHSEGGDEGSILNQWEDDNRGRRLSTLSVGTISTDRSSADFVFAREASPPSIVRRSMIVGKLPLPFGREAEMRSRAVSMGSFRRNSGLSVTSDTGSNTPNRSFSPLSREWKDEDKKRDSLLSMPSRWLSVTSREGSVRSVHIGESEESKQRAGHGGSGSISSVLLDDGASGRSGTYYSARSSFSTSG